MDLLPVEPYPRGRLTSSWKISNEYRPISGIRYMIMWPKNSADWCEYDNNREVNTSGRVSEVTSVA